MGNVETSLAQAMRIDGAVGVALVDYETGMSLGQAGGGVLDLDVAAVGSAEVLKAGLRTMVGLGLPDQVEDVLVTLGSRHHLIRPLHGGAGTGLFVFLALDRARADLDEARRRLDQLEQAIEL